MTPYIEPTLVGISWSSLVVYHLHLVYKVRRKPLTTTVGIDSHVRCGWVKSVTESFVSPVNVA